MNEIHYIFSIFIIFFNFIFNLYKFNETFISITTLQTIRNEKYYKMSAITETLIDSYLSRFWDEFDFILSFVLIDWIFNLLIKFVFYLIEIIFY